MVSSRGHPTISIKGQRENILGFVDHLVSAPDIVSSAL